jgi:hypothetical protein
VALQRFLKCFLVLLSDSQVVTEAAPEEPPALLTADFDKVLVVFTDQLLLDFHKLGLRCPDRRELVGSKAWRLVRATARSTVLT